MRTAKGCGECSQRCQQPQSNAERTKGQLDVMTSRRNDAAQEITIDRESWKLASIDQRGPPTVEALCHHQYLRAVCFSFDRHAPGAISDQSGGAWRARQSQQAIDQRSPRGVNVFQVLSCVATHEGLCDEPRSRHRIGDSLRSFAIPDPGDAGDSLHCRVAWIQDPSGVQPRVPRGQPEVPEYGVAVSAARKDRDQIPARGICRSGSCCLKFCNRLDRTPAEHVCIAPQSEIQRGKHDRGRQRTGQPACRQHDKKYHHHDDQRPGRGAAQT